MKTRSEASDAGADATTGEAPLEASELRVASLRIILVTAGSASLLFFLFATASEGPSWKRLPVGLFGLAALVFAALDLRRLAPPVTWVFLPLVWAIAAFGMVYNGGVFGTAGYTLFLLVLCSAFVLGFKGVIGATGISLATVTGIYLLDHAGLLAPRATEYSKLACLIALDVQLLAAGLFLALIARQSASLFRRLATSRQDAVASEARLQVFYRSAFEGITLSREGMVIDLNDRAAKLLGRSPETCIGTPIATYIPPDELPRVHARLRLDDGTPYEHHLIHASGEKIPVRVQTRNLFEGPDRLRASTFVDLRPERAASAREEALEARLHRSSRLEALGTLASGVAHEFNNLLAAIQAFVQLAEAASSGEAREDLRDALRATERGRDLVAQILASSQRSRPKEELVDLDALLNEVARLLQATLPRTVQIKVKPGAGAEILGDHGALHQVLLNLATNAAHAMEESKGTLTLSLAAETLDDARAQALDLVPGHYLALSVSDDGHGMEAATLEHCFEPFFTTKTRGQGTGLGLSVVHGIIRSHRGAIEVRSQVGEGTHFTLYLPAATPEQVERLRPRPRTVETPPPARARSTPQDPPAKSRARVLYIDDEELLCRATTRLLGSGGFEAEASGSPDEVLGWLRDDPDRYQVIISDYSMPEMNGVDLIRRLRALGVRAPAILCSGNVDLFSSDEIRELGIHAVLQKPCGTGDLREAVARAIAAAAPGDPGEQA